MKKSQLRKEAFKIIKQLSTASNNVLYDSAALEYDSTDKDMHYVADEVRNILTDFVANEERHYTWICPICNVYVTEYGKICKKCETAGDEGTMKKLAKDLEKVPGIGISEIANKDE